MKVSRSLVAVVLAVVLVATACGGPDQPDATDTAASSTTGSAGGFEGAWFGNLLPGVRIQLQLARDQEGRLTGVFDAIEDGVMGLPTQIEENGSDLTVTIEQADAVATVTLTEDDQLEGEVIGNGETLPVALVRRDEPFAFDRPQEPDGPLPYLAEDVTFPNVAADIALAGTLTTPEGAGPFPAVVLVSGSGPQDRDEQLAGHRPFLVLADHLTRAGIAVLRYDDRGYGASEGEHTGALTPDFAADAGAAVDFLLARPGVDPSQVGIIGHSEGGMIAPLVAVGRPAVSFVVMLAGPGLPGDEILMEQGRLITAAEGVPDAIADWQAAWTTQAITIAASDADDDAARAEFKGIAAEAFSSMPEFLAGQVEEEDLLLSLEGYLDPWLRWFLAFDPAPTLGAVSVPILALFGEFDLQVPAGSNQPALERILASGMAPEYEIQIVPGVNHLFQHTDTGAISEYSQLTETMAPEILDLITGWLLRITGS